MGEAYEFDGQLFTNSGEFLDAVAHEYKSGDRDMAVQALEDYGFTVGDIGAHTDAPHPQAASDSADPTQERDQAA